MPARWPSPVYAVSVEIQAPLKFTYDWCTDYTAEDGQISGEGHERRILAQSAREVVLEDLYDTPKGWIWVRRTIRLMPPNRWRADSIGSDRALSVDYSLSEMPNASTALKIRARRRPYGIGTKNPPKRTWERRVAINWSNFARKLEKDYRGRSNRD